MKRKPWLISALGVVIFCGTAPARSESIAPNALNRDYFLTNADAFLYFRKTGQTVIGELVAGLSQGTAIGVCFKGKALDSKIVDVTILAQGYSPQKEKPIDLSSYKRYEGRIAPSHTEDLEFCIQEFRKLKRY